jgi:hypothetical protein
MSMRPITVVLGVSLVVASAADAQEQFTRAGFGIAFLASSPVGALTGTSTLYVLAPTSPGFRLEPIIGWHHDSFDESSSNATSPTSGISVANTAFLLGLGLFGTAHPGAGATLIYYGPRLGVAWTKRTFTDQSANSLSDKQTDWFLTWVIGGEHRISHFSVGGDVGLSYLKWGKPNFEHSGAGATTFVVTSAGGSSVGTSSSAFVRWYF